MRQIIAWLKGTVFRFWEKDEKPKRRTAKRREKEHFGAHYYLGDLLENLDSCSDDFKLLKSSDPDAYKLYRKVGAAVHNGDYLYSTEMQPHLFASGMPAFAAMFFGKDRKDWSEDKVHLKFAYVVKQKRFVNVQISNGSIYKIGLIYKDRQAQRPFYDECYMSVGPNGDVMPLKICRPKAYPCGKGPRVVRMTWEYPAILDELSREDNDFEHGDVTAVARFILTYVIQGYSALESGFMVRATKGGVTSAFAIDMLRTPYFFADRVKVKNENGNTKLIFHYVKGHMRGNQFIKPHFRGLRKFHWNGYDVSVSMPAKHHRMISEADFDAVDEIDVEDGVSYLTAQQVGDRVAERLDA